ncbi:RNA polymerase sigma factor [Candidatus Entotheonella palauensis]|uniref:RNA polymerase sigma factor n=1 Tax=Candidatus Entotheonella palauensis TaxID=93172 RepID=UPI0015C4913A|nr:RNA polymerase sigma factor [Candidatus Entotheonella palauensis]
MQLSKVHDSYQDTEERCLLRRIAAQDRQAFEVLYNRYAPRLRIYLTRLLKRHELVDETLNDVMLVLWQKADRRPPAVPLIAWLYGIARHKAYKAFTQATSADVLSDAPEPMSSGLGPEHTLLDDEQGRTLERALDTLPPHERTAIELLLHQGQTYQEIAEHMETSVNTVKTLMRCGRQRLAARVTRLEGSREFSDARAC